MRIQTTKCQTHGEQCGILVTSILPHVNSYNTCTKQYSTRNEMYASIYSHYATTYVIDHEKRGVRYVGFHEESYSKWYQDFYTPASQIPLRTFTNHKNELVGTNSRLHAISYEAAILVDRVLADSLRLFRRPERNALENMIYDRTSVYNILTKLIDTPEGEKVPMYYFATNDVSLPKQMNLMREFARDTTRRGVTFERIRLLLPNAMTSLREALDTQQYRGTFKFMYSPRKYSLMVKFGTSGGIVNMDTAILRSANVTIRFANSGKKIVLFEAAAREAHHILLVLMTNNEEQIDKMIREFMPLNVTKWKQEIRYLFEKLSKDMIKASLKAREFFIPSLTITFLSDLLHAKRMLIERGRMAMIGVTAWHGGWYQVALLMNYNNPDLFWVDGDITALDKHITDWMLYTYLAAGAEYYDWRSMNGEQRRLLKRLYTLLMYHVTNKITLQPGTIWRLIRGVMYSGGKETSHGDSWIMALIFFLYVEFVKITYPFAAPFISECVIKRFIAIIIYGDDHIWCCPKAFRGMFSAVGFATFLKEYLGMELRDYKEYDKFLSEINPNKGTFFYRGPKFLKRYFVANFLGPDSAPVLPFKPPLETCVRLCSVSEEEGELGLILKSIGQAYDTMGTCIPAYNAAYTTYTLATSRCSVTPWKLYMEWKDDPARAPYVKNIIKKVGMTPEEIFDAFPTLQDLQSRHVWIPSKCNNSVAGDIFL